MLNLHLTKPILSSHCAWCAHGIRWRGRTGRRVEHHLYFRWLQLRELGKSSIARLVCVHYYRYCCSCCCGCPRCENKFPRSSISASSIVTRKIIPVIPCALVHCRPRIILNDGVGATSVLGVRMRLRRWPNHWLCLSRW